MNTTINEEIAHDCVQELLEKLADERKLSSDQNVRITELEEQIGHMVDFVMAFGAWLEREKSACKDHAKRHRHEIGSADEWHVMTNASIKWNELKAQHLGDDSKT